jgi:hypothetical protein
MGGNESSHAFDRRAVLRAAGVALSLPLLESLAPRASASESRKAPARRRVLWVYAPNGVNPDPWIPRRGAGGLEFGPSTAPFAPFLPWTTCFEGLVLDKARANGDGPGDHARANAAFLTTRQPLKQDGAEIRCGVSIDQAIARQVGRATRFSSLVVGPEGGSASGQCDSGYSCAYSNHLSWADESTPMPKETDPRRLFQRLFADGDPDESAAERAARLARRRSVLDSVLSDAKSLEGRISRVDRDKLDQYFTAVRELERRLDAARAGAAAVPPGATEPGAWADRTQQLHLLSDVLVLALRAVATRVATFALANEGSGRSFAELGIHEGHHELSHHAGDAGKMEKIARIDRHHCEVVARLLAALAAAEEDGEPLLARTMVVFGSGIRDGNRHDHDHLPLLLFGGGHGFPRGFVDAREAPLANLHLAVAERMGAKLEAFGDSTGILGA